MPFIIVFLYFIAFVVVIGGVAAIIAQIWFGLVGKEKVKEPNCNPVGVIEEIGRELIDGTSREISEISKINIMGQTFGVTIEELIEAFKGCNEEFLNNPDDFGEINESEECAKQQAEQFISFLPKMVKMNSISLQEEDNVSERFSKLKKAVENVLHMTYSGGNGGFVADFGVVTLKSLVDATGFDMDKRKCLKMDSSKGEPIEKIEMNNISLPTQNEIDDQKLEELTEHNTNVVSQFMYHCEKEGYDLPDRLFESFFDA